MSRLPIRLACETDDFADLILLAQGAVIALTVFWDLIVAVAVGCILSSLHFTRRMAEIEIEACTVICSDTLRAEAIPHHIQEGRMTFEELDLIRRCPGDA